MKFKKYGEVFKSSSKTITFPYFSHRLVTPLVIDFAKPTQALGINPVGQSGVLFDQHYSDQAEPYIKGQYVPQHFSETEVAANTQSTLHLLPAK